MENYKEIGLKAGLEIHQQLDTNKLFCECPSVLRKDKPSPPTMDLPPDDGFEDFGTPAELQPLDQDDLKGLEPQQSKSSELDYQKLLRDPVFVSSIADAVIAKLQRTGKI